MKIFHSISYQTNFLGHQKFEGLTYRRGYKRPKSKGAHRHVRYSLEESSVSNKNEKNNRFLLDFNSIMVCSIIFVNFKIIY